MSQFPLSFLQAVSDWQRGGDPKQNKKRGHKLKKACESLPANFRTCALPLFRQVGLPKGGVWSLIGEDCLPEKVSSWTLSLETAMAFKGGVPPEGQGYQGVIFCISPTAGSIIANLHELYESLDFLNALDKHQKKITGYHDGAGRYRDHQLEIVLDIASVTKKDIYSIGGHSNPFDELFDQAATLLYGHRATPEESEALMLNVKHVRSEAGPKWLSPEATQRVVTKMKPHAERLRSIKRHQDAEQ